MLTIIVMLSGPHRLGWLQEALDSIPWDAPELSRVQVMHQGGAWDWAPAIRARIEAHPKGRVFEYPQRLDYTPNYNRYVETVQTDWFLLLPDDDSLLSAACAAALPALRDPAAAGKGFAAFGWYYLERGRYLADHVKKFSPPWTQRYAPKFCSTFISTQRFREIGGFDARCGGFIDAVLFARLAFEFGALMSPTPMGIYRLHDDQLSSQRGELYGSYIEATIATIGAYARDDDERRLLERNLRAFVDDSPGLVVRLGRRVLAGLRGLAGPRDGSHVAAPIAWTLR